MTRKRLYALALGAALSLSALTPLQAQTDLRIGFVNVPYLIQNAPQTAALNERLRSEFAPREAELQTMAEGLQEKLDMFERDASVMGESERAALEREIREGDRDLQRRQSELQEDFSIRQEELLGELQNIIARQVQTYADGQGYDLIFANVVYASDAVDITEDVLAAISAGSGSE
jgi:outer membrane protein